MANDRLAAGQTLGSGEQQILAGEHVAELRANPTAIAANRAKGQTGHRDNIAQDLGAGAGRVGRPGGGQPAELIGKDVQQESDQNKGRDRNTDHDQHGDRMIGDSILFQSSPDAQQNADWDRNKGSDQAQAEGNPDTGSDDNGSGDVGLIALAVAPVPLGDDILHPTHVLLQGGNVVVVIGLAVLHRRAVQRLAKLGLVLRVVEAIDVAKRILFFKISDLLLVAADGAVVGQQLYENKDDSFKIYF